MKVKSLFSMAALLFVAALTGCSSDDFTETNVELPDTSQETIPFTTTVAPKLEGTRALAEATDGNGLTYVKVYWEDGSTEGKDADRVAILANNQKVGWAKVTKVLSDGSAILEGEITTTSVVGNVKLIYPEAAADEMVDGELPKNYYKYQLGTLEDIEKRFAFAISNESPLVIDKDGVARTKDRVRLENQNAICKFRFTNMNEKLTVDKLVITDDQNNVITLATMEKPTTEGVYIAMQPWAENPTLLFKVTANKETTGIKFYIGSAIASIKAGKFYDLDYLNLGEATKTDYEIVDLGLSVDWGKYNINYEYEKASDYQSGIDEYNVGTHFAWGAIAPPPNGQYSNGNAPYRAGGGYSKYTDKNIVNGDGTTTPGDGLTVLSTLKDDAARNAWGAPWRMPTEEEYKEFINLTTQEVLTTSDGKKYIKFTSKQPGYNSGKYYLIMAYNTGAYNESVIEESTKDKGYYWSSSLGDKLDRSQGGFLDFSNENASWNGGAARNRGHVIRPVYDEYKYKDNDE